MISYGGVACVGIALAGLAALSRAAMAPKRRMPKPAGFHSKVSSTRVTFGKINAQIVYPTGASEGTYADYTPSHSASGLGVAFHSKLLEYIGWFFLANQRHPDFDSAPPCKKHADRLPLVIFSHGLFGTQDMYLQLLRDIASHGAVVVAPTHNDGTSSYNPHVIPYVSPPKEMVYDNKEEVCAFRKPFLEKRDAELNEVLSGLKEHPIWGSHIDFEKVILAGHSFGGATVMHYGSNHDDVNIKGYLLYDTWTHPVEEEVQVTRPFLAVQSESFANNGEAAERNRRLGMRKHRDAHSFWIPNTTHQLWSDFALLIPARLNPTTNFGDPTNQWAAWVEATHLFMDHHFANDGNGVLDIPETEHRIGVSVGDTKGRPYGK